MGKTQHPNLTVAQYTTASAMRIEAVKFAQLGHLEVRVAIVSHLRTTSGRSLPILTQALDSDICAETSATMSCSQ